MNTPSEQLISPPSAVGRPVARASSWRALGIVFLLSLAVRLALWAPVASFGTPALFDETGYLVRAQAYARILTAAVTHGLGATDPGDWDKAYRQGSWPPLHPLLLGIVLAIFGGGAGVARLAIVAQSALTTSVAFFLTDRLAGRRAAWGAALVHAFYPSFLGWSHLLWSESTYMLMLLTSLYFAVRAADEQRPGRRLGLSGLCGVFLGLAALTRTAALPLLAVVPAWLLWRGRGPFQRFATPAMLLVALAATLTPWEWTLGSREHRFVMLSTKSGYYLYEGNNPWMGQEHAIRQMKESLDQYARQHDLDRDRAGRNLAWEYILGAPAGAARRGLERMRALWTPDWYLMRHVLCGAYPATSSAAALAILALLTASLPVYLAGALWGLFARGAGLRQRGLLLACLLATMAPNALTIANSRLTLPLLALLLPAAGAGFAGLTARRAWARGGILLIAIAGGLWLLNPHLPYRALGSKPFASSLYAPAVRVMERCFGTGGIGLRDCVLVRNVGPGASGPLEIELLDEGALLDGSTTRRARFEPLRPGECRPVNVRLKDICASTPTLRLVLPRTAQAIEVRPVESEGWRRWRATGLPGIEIAWVGAMPAFGQDLATGIKRPAARENAERDEAETDDE